MSEPSEHGDPTQKTPEELIQQIEHAALECRMQLEAGLVQLNSSIETMQLLLAMMQRNNRRMEILRQTMRPAPPIPPKQNDDRLCLGERVIVRCLRAHSAESIAEISRRTHYAESSIRTWLPMLRTKKIVHPSELCLAETPQALAAIEFVNQTQDPK